MSIAGLGLHLNILILVCYPRALLQYTSPPFFHVVFAVIEMAFKYL